MDKNSPSMPPSPQALVQCLSHSPAMAYRPLRDSRGTAVEAALDDARRAMAAFAPELVVVFGPDHYNGFFYDLMPSFCVGARAVGLGDYGSSTAELNVDSKHAALLHAHLIAEEFEAAISYDMRVDHAFVQPLEQVLAPGTAPVVPVFMNCIANPVPSCRRVLRFGEAVGRYCRASGKRVAFLGSGGLSHDPPLPDIQTAAPSDRDRIITRKYLGPSERTERETRTLAAADRFAAGEPGLAPLNEAWDRGFMGLLERADWAALENLRDAEITAEAGRSGHEVRAWLAAFGALRAYGPYRIEQSFYSMAPEWIVAYGALRAAPVA